MTRFPREGTQQARASLTGKLTPTYCEPVPEKGRAPREGERKRPEGVHSVARGRCYGDWVTVNVVARRPLSAIEVVPRYTLLVWNFTRAFHCPFGRGGTLITCRLAEIATLWSVRGHGRSG